MEYEVKRRRNFAIVSHPDAGKSTLTEKLLLYGGAINEAGAVKSRANQRKITSDWMEMEKQRGISITSTCLSFEYEGCRINLLDTPGHQDFSEDTFRSICAVDNAVMLVDAAKGLEPQTRKLFEVCRMGKLPIFTFANKLDRPSMTPWELIDQIENEFGLQMCPITWPIGDGDRFSGVLDRDTKLVHLFERGDRKKKAEELACLPVDDERLADLLDEDLYSKLLEDMELLDGLIEPLDMPKVLRGEQSPMFFGSAMATFGVELFLNRFLTLGQSPPPRKLDSEDEVLQPDYPEFSAFVFKLQANLDPRHRDRLAFMRVVSGRYEPGLRVNHSRLAGRQINLASASQLFASERETISEAYPGDVIGVMNPGTFAIGDTLYTGNQRVRFPGIPSFSPERFMYVRGTPSQRKNFEKGLRQLLDEGAVQMLRERWDEGGGIPVLAAVGQLQFDVVKHRLLSEYNVDCTMEALAGYDSARWCEAGWEEVDAADAKGLLFGVMQLKDMFDRPVLLFRNQWKVKSVEEEVPTLDLSPWAAPPDITVRGRKGR
jgi:peptide chain release factor 3